ncbi:MAG: ABC transporter permease [Alphaproteobacteria bacterium]|nr:ABC transporter permease [Alphaproteobacteria bacterium]
MALALSPAARGFVQRYGTTLACAAVFAGFALSTQHFLNPANLLNVLKQISYLTVIALGFTMALIAAELDLSFANVASLCSVVAAGLMHAALPVSHALLASFAVGIGIGLVNGWLVTGLRIPSLVATLATATIAAGLAFLITGGVAYVGRLPPSFLFIGRGELLGVPMLIVWTVLAVVLAQFFIKQTRTGIHMVCTGEAEDAARLAGIPVVRLKVLGLALSGLGAAAAGIMLTASLSSGSATIAGDFLMRGIAAVLLGMTTVEPGRPNVPGTVIGALIIGMLTNGLTLLGATYYIQDIVLGVIIIASVAVSASQMRRAAFGVPR